MSLQTSFADISGRLSIQVTNPSKQGMVGYQVSPIQNSRGKKFYQLCLRNPSLGLQWQGGHVHCTLGGRYNGHCLKAFLTATNAIC